MRGAATRPLLVVIALLGALAGAHAQESAKFPTDDAVRNEMKAIRDLTPSTPSW